MNREKNVKKAFFWNMVGSTCYSVSSFLYLMAVTRACGETTAGFFSLSYATAQLLLTVGRYGMRTYQATDLDREYRFSEYGISRVITCGVMMLIGVIYSGFSFTGEKIATSIFIILMKMVDAVEDVFHGNFQQKYHVEEMGKLLAARNVFSAALFMALIFTTRDLYVTCGLTAVLSLAVCLLINIWATRHYLGAEHPKSASRETDDGGRRSAGGATLGKNLVQLLKTCTPPFVGTFLSLLLYNIPKYAMAGVMSDEYQTYYSILFMPSFVITLMCEFVFKPTITTVAELWQQDNRKKFTVYVLRILGLILLAGAAIVVAGHLLGRTLLELIYAVDLSPYKLHFVLLLVGGCIGAEVYMLYNILIAIRKGSCIIVAYGITAVLTILPAESMVRNWGILGACLNYLYSCSVLFLIFAVILTYIIIRERPAPKETDVGRAERKEERDG